MSVKKKKLLYNYLHFHHKKKRLILRIHLENKFILVLGTYQLILH